MTFGDIAKLYGEDSELLFNTFVATNRCLGLINPIPSQDDLLSFKPSAEFSRRLADIKKIYSEGYYVESFVQLDTVLDVILRLFYYRMILAKDNRKNLYLRSFQRLFEKNLINQAGLGIATYLHEADIIDSILYKRIKKIKEERNKLVHGFHPRYLSLLEYSYYRRNNIAFTVFDSESIKDLDDLKKLGEKPHVNSKTIKEEKIQQAKLLEGISISKSLMTVFCSSSYVVT